MLKCKLIESSLQKNLTISQSVNQDEIGSDSIESITSLKDTGTLYWQVSTTVKPRFRVFHCLILPDLRLIIAAI